MRCTLTFADSFLCTDCGIILHRVQGEIDLRDRFLLYHGALQGNLHGEGGWSTSRKAPSQWEAPVVDDRGKVAGAEAARVKRAEDG